MRSYVSFSFDGANLPGGFESFLRAAGICDDEFRVARFAGMGITNENAWVTVNLPEGDERIPRVLELLKLHGKDVFGSGFDRYTDEELDNARLLMLRPARGAQVHGGSEFGTTYDLKGACPSCGAGARQTSALFVEGWNDGAHWMLEGERAAQTYRNEILVDDPLAAELEALSPTGLVLRQVYAVMPDTQRQVELAYKQLSADRILPPMLPLTEGIFRNDPCPVCPRGGYWLGAAARVFYRARDLEGADDVNLSWEGQHRGEINEDPRKCQIPVPIVLVTPKVMRVFRAAGITEFEWIPIRVVDE